MTYPQGTDASEWAVAFKEQFKQHFKTLPPTTDLHEFFSHCIAEARDSGYIQAGIDHNVEQGFIEVAGSTEDGNPTYRMTEAGKRRVEDMLAGRNG